MYFSSNIKFLRRRRERTQEDVSAALVMKRSTLNNYENAISQPGMETLVAFSNYYNIAIDTLIRVDLPSLPESQIRQLERGYDVHLKGTKLRVLVTTVGNDNEENIELVSEKAKAGYATGFADPEYISILPTFRLPFPLKTKKVQDIPGHGDSMLPIPHGSWVTGVFMQDWSTIRDKDACIILTSDEGIVFKVIENRIREAGKLTLHSLNPMYDPYDIPVKDIREIWQFVNYISGELPENQISSGVELIREVKELRKECRQSR